jgi:hypothetical protein
MAAAIIALGTTAHGQGGTTSTLSGVVVDSAGGVVPGAEVSIKHNGTGLTETNVSNSQGAFSFPGLNVGTYTVTISLQGFKTVVINDVVLTSGAPASVRGVLEVGGLEEQIVVSSASEIVQTQSSTISTTINTNQINKLPITTRSAMDFVTLLPGVTTAGGNRQSQINGLPRGAINITLDGVNIQDNTLRSTDGFFAIVSPRLDAIEEVSVTTATQGADSAQGAVQIRFVTRSGTNDFTGSGYHYYRSDKLNANTWFNNRDGVDKTPLKQNQTGIRAGGPIVIPGLFNGRNRAFFFANYEEFRQPGAVTRSNRQVLTPQAQQGIFRYTAGGAQQSVNLLALAAANGQTSTADPTVAAVLGSIRSAVSGGSLAPIDANLERFTFNVATTSLRRYPTFRVDYNISDKHRFSSAFNYQYFTDAPDTLNNMDASFPGFAVQAGQKSERYGWSNSVRSTLTQNLVNEARVGYSGAPVEFFNELNPGMYADQGNFRLAFPNVTGMNPTSANPTSNFNPQSRNASSLLLENTLTWLKGSHSFSMGGSWSQYDLWLKNQQIIPTINVCAGTQCLVTGDPAQAMFNGTNFPGASAAQLTAAQALYSLVTGRVSEIVANAALAEETGNYQYLGLSTQRGRMREAGLFVQDSWRLNPNFTVNAGLRYELQFPFEARNGSYSTATIESFCGISGTNPATLCNVFQAGALGGVRPTFINMAEGQAAYDTDWDNIAPSVGFAWTLKGQSGILGTILGSQEGDSVVRGGFTRAYSREGMARFSDQFGANPGVTIDATRSNGNNNLTAGGPLPVLYRDSARLGAPPIPERPNYPLSDVITQDVNLIDPDIKVPYADSWTAGIQRTLGRDMAVEVRYVGTLSRENWQTINYNEINVFENGFINEFRNAQANLRANVAAGLANQGFRYRGPGTGTVPLPVLFAFFQGTGNPNNPAAYTSANFTTNNTFLTPLAQFNPTPFLFANNLYANAGFRANAAAAGIPENYFLMNPDLQGGADLTTSLGKSDYHSLQIDLRRRLAQGLQFQTSYVFGNMRISQFDTLRREQFMIRDAGDPGDITHTLKLNAVYDLPFGQGRRFAGNAGPLLDRLVGGWTVSLVSRIQSGRLIDIGNVRLVGMTAADVQDFFRLRFDDAGRKVWMLPQDVIDNTIKAFGVSATSATGYGAAGAPTGRYFAPANGPDCIEPDRGTQNAPNYGECGGRSLVLTGPMFQQHDLTISKRVRLIGAANVEFRMEALNVFNNVNFVPVGIGYGTQTSPTAIANYEVTALTGTNTSRVIQLVTRINW